MIYVPEEVKVLVNNPSIKKNLRVHFVNGEHADLTNTDIDGENFSFTESLCSSGEFRYGKTEASHVEFTCVNIGNVTGALIDVELDVDCSTLGEEWCDENASASEDLAYAFYPIPYGQFVINEAKKSADMQKRSIVAYTKTEDLSKPFNEEERWCTKYTVIDQGYYPASEYMLREYMSGSSNIETRVFDANVLTDFATNKINYNAYTKTVLSSIKEEPAIAGSILTFNDLFVYEISDTESLVIRPRFTKYIYYTGQKGKVDSLYDVKIKDYDLGLLESNAYRYLSDIRDSVLQYAPVEYWNSIKDDLHKLLVSCPAAIFTQKSWRSDFQNAYIIRLSLNGDSLIYMSPYNVDSSISSDVVIGTGVSIRVAYYENSTSSRELIVTEAYNDIPSSNLEVIKYTSKLNSNIYLKGNLFYSDTYDYYNGFYEEYKKLDFDKISSDVYELMAVFGKVDRYGEYKTYLVGDTLQYPANDLYPSESLYPSGGISYSRNRYRSVWYEDENEKPYSRVFTQFTNKNGGLEELTVYVEGYDASNYTIGKTYDLSDNNLIKTNTYTTEEMRSILETIANNLPYIRYRQIEMEANGMPWLEAEDYISVSVPEETFQTLVMRRTLKGINVLTDTISSTV